MNLQRLGEVGPVLPATAVPCRGLSGEQQAPGPGPSHEASPGSVDRKIRGRVVKEDEQAAY